MESREHALPSNSAAQLETTSVITTPIMKLPGSKLLVVTTTHITSVVDDPLASTITSTNEECSTVVMQNESPAPHLDGLNDYPSGLLLRTPTPVAKPFRKRVKTACARCHEVRKTCDAVRPCKRCRREGVECKDRARKPMRGLKVGGKKATRRTLPSGTSQTVPAVLATPGPATTSAGASMLSPMDPTITVASGGPVETYIAYPERQDAWLGLNTDPLLAQLGWLPSAEEAGYRAPFQSSAMVHNIFPGAGDFQPRS
ncbi:hypothetical protein OH76DRAFT_1401147 [Lentinus brumalis]|uniref:Zn(2)-C6 fungal-type domain-containing protein n=1 Tax=Lentinus brumalis TaxID=2498619 RepID=A0A371DGU9_9APHY|nr:hypothetical protein OH76DRAFT_1401147 [Polyporus brumalis]